MDQYNLNVIYLHSQQGSVDSIKYDFECQSRNKHTQDNATYFILPLQETNCSEPNSWFQEEQSQNKPKNYLGGMIYCNWKGVAEKFKKEFIYTFKHTIYYNIGNYQDAFQSAINSLQEYILSLDLVCDAGSQVWSGYDTLSRTQVSANFFMKLDGQLYLSKSISPNDNCNNIWCIKEKGSNQFRNLDLTKDIKHKSDQCYMLSEDVAQNIDELILSDSSNLLDTIVTDIKKKYPVLCFDYFYFYNMHFLKLSNIF